MSNIPATLAGATVALWTLMEDDKDDKIAFESTKGEFWWFIGILLAFLGWSIWFYIKIINHHNN